MRTFALALLAAVAAAVAKSAAGPVVASKLVSFINLEAATSSKTTTVTVGGEVIFADEATADQDDIGELAVCWATETDKKYFCVMASFQQLNNASGNVQTAKITPHGFSATVKPVVDDFVDA